MVTTWERFRDRAERDPRAAVALARDETPVAAPSMIDRLASDHAAAVMNATLAALTAPRRG